MKTGRPAISTITVTGTGLVSALSRISLSKTLGRSVEIRGDPSGIALSTPPKQSVRAFALAADSVEFLRSLGIWNLIGAHACETEVIELASQGTHSITRSPDLIISRNDFSGNALCSIIEERFLWKALREITSQSETCEPFQPLTRKPDLTVLTRRPAPDPARSIFDRFLSQTAFSGILSLREDHHNRLYQRFLTSGPLAILPLDRNRMSFIWSVSNRCARNMIDQSENWWLDQLNSLIGWPLHVQRLDSEIGNWRLAEFLARDWVGPSQVRIGDAAHRLHPVAGQGLNLAIRDIQALNAALKSAQGCGMPLNNNRTLLEYQQQRRSETMKMALITRSLGRPPRYLRSLSSAILGTSFRLVHQSPFLRSTMVCSANGSGKLRGQHQSRDDRMSGST